MWTLLLAVMFVAAGAIGEPTIIRRVESTSFEFLDKLTQKEYRSILNLTMQDASIHKVNPRLKYLKNLEHLDMSNNNVQLSTLPSFVHLKTLKLSKNSLKYVNMTALPPNIQELDLSNNLLTAIPKDWEALRSLKVLHFQKNLIDCNCYNVLNYQRVIEKGIQVTGPLLCHSPTNYVGKDISSISCTLHDIMQYDEAVEGSGASDIFEENLDEGKTNVAFEHETEDEDQIVDQNTIIDEKLPVEEELVEHNSEKTHEEVIEQEGSGDEGSGFGIPLPASGILGCIEDCSTPGPVGAHDEEYASPVPGPIESVKILLEDMNIFKNPETKTTTPITATTGTIEKTESEGVVKEPRILKKNNYKEESGKPDDVEVFANSTEPKELERASVVPKDMTAVYAILGVILFLAVVCTFYFIKNRRSKNHNNRREIPLLGEEMKSMNKPVVQEINEKSSKGPGNIPENLPLLNGQNGKPRSDSPKLTSYVPLAHPEFLNDDEDEKVAQVNGVKRLPSDEDNVGDDADVEVRSKTQPELLTPGRQRVTVRESEIPEPIPKTPLLVHRQMNSDGEFVNMPVP